MLKNKARGFKNVLNGIYLYISEFTESVLVDNCTYLPALGVYVIVDMMVRCVVLIETSNVVVMSVGISYVVGISSPSDMDGLSVVDFSVIVVLYIVCEYVVDIYVFGLYVCLFDDCLFT